MSSQPVERPLEGLNRGKFGKIGIGLANAAGVRTSYSNKLDQATHSGSLITTSDGRQYLVHKGDGFGKSGGDTVVTDAKHMTNRWEAAGPRQDVDGRATVADYVKAGGKDYRLRGADCHDATNNMQNLGRGGRAGVP